MSARIRAKKVKEDGHTFDSMREHARYCMLKLLIRAGEIEGLQVHPRFPIVIGGVPILMRSARYPNGRQLTYVADFRYRRVGEIGPFAEWVIEDSKGHRTEVYKLKLALVQAMGLEILET